MIATTPSAIIWKILPSNGRNDLLHFAAEVSGSQNAEALRNQIVALLLPEDNASHTRLPLSGASAVGPNKFLVKVDGIDVDMLDKLVDAGIVTPEFALKLCNTPSPAQVRG